MPRFKVLYIYVVEAPTKAQARLEFAQARQDGRDEEYLEVITIKEVDDPGLLGQVRKQLGV